MTASGWWAALCRPTKSLRANRAGHVPEVGVSGLGVHSRWCEPRASVVEHEPSQVGCTRGVAATIARGEAERRRQHPRWAGQFAPAHDA